MVHRADRCSSVNYSDPKSVMVADGKNLWSKAYPCVLRKNPLDLPHWLLNESLPRTFISQRDVKALGHRTVYGPYKSDDFIQKTDGSTVPITWKNNLPHVDLNFGGPSVSNLRPSIDAINNFSIWHDDAFCECDCGLFWTASEKLLLHRQRGHFYDPKIKVFCPDCWVWKWKTAPHGKVRPVHLVPKRLWSVVDVDFKGPYPDSHFSNRYILWIIDQKSDWVEQYPVSSKDQCHEAFEKFLNQVVRSDEKRDKSTALPLSLVHHTRHGWMEKSNGGTPRAAPPFDEILIMLILFYGILQLNTSAISSIDWIAKRRKVHTFEGLVASPRRNISKDLDAYAIRRCILRLRYSTIVLSAEYS